MTELVESHHHPSWLPQHERILKAWAEIGSSYRYLHSKAESEYDVKNMRFTIPVIVISTITGTAAFSLSSMPASWQPIAPSVIGTFNLAAGLITTISNFLRVGELLEGHRSSAIQWGKFSRNIAVELSLPVDERHTSGEEFISKCRVELDKLIENSPNLPTSIVEKFGKKFKRSVFTKPEILDIRAIEVFTESTIAKLDEIVDKKANELSAKALKRGEETRIKISDIGLDLEFSNLLKPKLDTPPPPPIKRGAGKKEDE